MKLLIKNHDVTVDCFELSQGKSYVLGRSTEADCPVPSERCLSRRHATLRPSDGELAVEQMPDAANAILFAGAQADSFTMSPGEFFVIGETTVQFVTAQPSAPDLLDDSPSYQYSPAAAELKERGRFGDRMRLLDLMELPVVLRTKTRTEFFVYACGSLRLAAAAAWAQVLHLEDDRPVVLAEDAADDRGGTKPVSRRLIDAAIKDAPRPIAYCWEGSTSASTVDATAHEGIGWAVCCAMPVPGEQPLLFYVAGAAEGGRAGPDLQASSDMTLRDNARLVGLVADMIGRTLAVEKLQTWQSRLGRFFSGKIVSKILESDANEALAPRIAEATVMFFDIRGFSLRTERNLNRIIDFTEERQSVLTAMTQCVFDHDGVVISYAGDGILACWNTPYPIENHPELACRAALLMTDRMAEVTDGWQCGIGLGLGDVVAGSLGSEQVYAFDILGAVVNQTSRVEGITKAIAVPILITAEVASRLNAAELLTRRVARFVPAGMQEALDLYTVEPMPETSEDRETARQRIAVHAKGLEAFERGEWETAWKTLNPIIGHDAAARYVFTIALQGKAPRDWHGTIELTEK